MSDSQTKDVWVREAFGADPAGYPPSARPEGRGRRDEDDEMPYVSMRLPDEPKRGGPKQKVVQMEALELGEGAKDDAVAKEAIGQKELARRDREAKEQADAALAEQALTRCVALTANYGVMIRGAADLFGVFAKKKIAETEPEASAWELLGPILGIAVGVLAAELTPLIAVTELGKKIVESSLSKAGEAAVAGAESALKKKGTSLEGAVDTIVAQSSLMSSAMRDGADRIVKGPLTELVSALKAKKPLTDKQRELIDGFYGKSIDAVLETMGLPQEITAKKVQMRVYSSMVQSFEEQRMNAYRADHDLSPDPRAVANKAKQNAREAVDALQAQQDELLRQH